MSQVYPWSRSIYVTLQRLSSPYPTNENSMHHLKQPVLLIFQTVKDIMIGHSLLCHDTTEYLKPITLNSGDGQWILLHCCPSPYSEPSRLVRLLRLSLSLLSDGCIREMMRKPRLSLVWSHRCASCLCLVLGKDLRRGVCVQNLLSYN